MKHIQGTKLTGYVTISVSGKHPEHFFQRLINKGIPAWDIQKVSKTSCKGKVSLKYVSDIKRIRRQTKYKISFIEKKGLPFFVQKKIKRKEIVFALLICVLLLFLLSNIIWDVKITGVTTDVEEKIYKELNTYGIHRGALTFGMASSKTLQQQLLNDVPDLLWIGVHKKGTTLFLEGVEKEIVEKKETHAPQHLVAAKDGVIQRMYISNGQARVKINDYVKQGDLLVSGIIESNKEENDNEKQQKQVVVAAEGEVIANTWYEVNVTVPLIKRFERLTGNYKTKKTIKFGRIQFPYWKIRPPEYARIYEEGKEKHLYFLKWKLPFTFIDITYHEKVLEKSERTKEDAIEIAIRQAKNELMLELGPKAQFISEKVLHEAIENGKVKVKLYISALENVAIEQQINQKIR
ncbi:sporulation protein YqfD [Virgibacillus sp. W0430]|uniref:sporulation protein YqfD n=1 Tax=Virgibacillus sp. W0430 TaxID=3391580 RepID=UPI003F47371B